MAWIYSQYTGGLQHNAQHVGSGYSGHGTGLNNPSAQNQPNIGPIPQGHYKIGPAHQPLDHLGPLALPLYPDAANTMFGRFGFFIHGDNPQMDHTASDGCIVLSRPLREAIAASGDADLTVIA